MIIGDIATKILCALHELREEREWRRGREERRKRAVRKKGWEDLYNHMSKNSVSTAPSVASQPASWTVREVAIEADRGGGADVRREEGSVEALGVLPLAQPPRKGDV
jgi:hypothetical protein